MAKKFIAFLVMLALMTTVVPAYAKPSDEMMVPDILIARPLGLVGIIIGSAIFVMALPVSIPSRSVENVGRRLVMDPIEYTFIRPVGDMDYKVGAWGTEREKSE